MKRLITFLAAAGGLLFLGRLMQGRGVQPYGRFMGLPYDLRPPTVDRIRESFWAPDDPRVLKPHAFGIGYSLNLGALARRLGLA